MAIGTEGSILFGGVSYVNYDTAYEMKYNYILYNKTHNTDIKGKFMCHGEYK